jgi:hypothetical protein
MHIDVLLMRCSMQFFEVRKWLTDPIRFVCEAAERALDREVLIPSHDGQATLKD